MQGKQWQSWLRINMFPELIKMTICFVCLKKIRWNEPGRTSLQLHGKMSKTGSSNTQKVAKNYVSKYNLKDLCGNANVIHTENRFRASLGKENWYRNQFSLPNKWCELFWDLFDIDYECHLKFCSPS